VPEDNIAVVIPPQIEEMIERMMSALDIPEQHEALMAYTSGWILGSAKKEYRLLVQRDGVPDDPRVIKLLCELALMRGLVKWHEIKDRPPPMPSIKNI
jgi:hypothetical protein